MIQVPRNLPRVPSRALSRLAPSPQTSLRPPRAAGSIMRCLVLARDSHPGSPPNWVRVHPFDAHGVGAATTNSAAQPRHRVRGGPAAGGPSAPAPSALGAAAADSEQDGTGRSDRRHSLLRLGWHDPCGLDNLCQSWSVCAADCAKGRWGWPPPAGRSDQVMRPFRGPSGNRV